MFQYLHNMKYVIRITQSSGGGGHDPTCDPRPRYMYSKWRSTSLQHMMTPACSALGSGACRGSYPRCPRKGADAVWGYPWDFFARYEYLVWCPAVREMVVVNLDWLASIQQSSLHKSCGGISVLHHTLPPVKRKGIAALIKFKSGSSERPKPSKTSILTTTLDMAGSISTRYFRHKSKICPRSDPTSPLAAFHPPYPWILSKIFSVCACVRPSVRPSPYR